MTDPRKKLSATQVREASLGRSIATPDGSRWPSPEAACRPRSGAARSVSCSSRSAGAAEQTGTHPRQPTAQRWTCWTSSRALRAPAGASREPTSPQRPPPARSSGEASAVSSTDNHVPLVGEAHRNSCTRPLPGLHHRLHQGSASSHGPRGVAWLRDRQRRAPDKFCSDYTLR